MRYGCKPHLFGREDVVLVRIMYDALVSFSSVGIPRLVVADGRPMPVFRLLKK